MMYGFLLHGCGCVFWIHLKEVPFLGRETDLEQDATTKVTLYMSLLYHSSSSPLAIRLRWSVGSWHRLASIASRRPFEKNGEPTASRRDTVSTSREFGHLRSLNNR